MVRELGPYLNFAKTYIEKVIEGSKHVTVRRGVVRPKFARVYLTCCGYIYAEAFIHRVHYVKLGEITSDIVHAEGFNSREELIQTLRNLYGDLGEGELVTVIHFTVLKKYENPISIRHG